MTEIIILDTHIWFWLINQKFQSGYTDTTHLRGFKTFDFSLVRVGGLRLCSSELYSPITFQIGIALAREMV